ncbi:MAG: hypothetical protein GX051_04385 [Clostridiales bacterium]|nr:hypothetical protein [Clostridiales bacterium]
MGYRDLSDEQGQKIIDELAKKNRDVAQQVVEAVNSGGLDRLLGNLSPAQNAMLSRLMNNPDAANELLKRFIGGEKDG